MVIKPKKQPVIRKGTTMSYEPGNFQAPSKYITTDDPQVILKGVKPYQGKYVVLDTETHPLDLDSHDLPADVVRRWVGSGKSAKPQDLPFCISICDGTTCYTIYDDLENGFRKFKALEPLLNNSDIEKIAHNAKNLAL